MIATKLVNMVYEKLLKAVNSGRMIKTSPYLSLTDLSERQKELLWKNFINRTEPIEKRYIKDLKAYFNKQAKSVLEVMAKYEETGRPFTVESIDISLFYPDEWHEELKVMNTKYNLESIKAGGDNADLLRKTFDINDVAITLFIANKEDTFAFGINDYTSALLRNQLLIGLENQEDMRQLTGRVQNVFNFNEKYRAKRIAQTEVIGAANFGSLESSKQSGVVWGNQWLAALDEHTRPNHAQLGREQVKVKLGDRFPLVNVEYPGDPSGAAENVVNCRCALKPILREPLDEE